MNDLRDYLLLPTSTAADLLGVHASTVKRWAEEGALKATKTDGGHRRFTLQDVLSGAHERGIPTFLDPFHPWESNVWTAIQAGAKKGDFTRLSSLGLAWLRQGETELLGRLFFEMGRRDEIPFTTFLDEAISGFMSKVGEEWLGGRLQVGEEHMATEMILEALIRLRFARESSGRPPLEPQGRRPVAVVGAAEGEFHALGAQAVRAILEGDGWKVYYLGSNVPLEDFAKIRVAQAADLICISFSSRASKPDLIRTIETLEERQRLGSPHALALGGPVRRDRSLGSSTTQLFRPDLGRLRRSIQGLVGQGVPHGGDRRG